VAAVVICGRDHPPYPNLPDRPAQDLGPLGGLNAALFYAASKGFDGVLCTGCDMPVFPDALASALIGRDAAIVEGQYMIGYWPASLATDLDAHMATSEDRSVRGWLRIARPRRVITEQLPNINTPDDLRRLEAEG
jgi:molybdopterin-guanine dinucleotide biosynthesis protein A